jgi:hypothetical protein
MAINRSYWRWALLGGVVLVLSASPVTAAPPAKVPVTYTASNGGGTNNGNYSTIVTMTLPAGKYLIGGNGTVTNQTGFADQISCNLYAGLGVSVTASSVNVAAAEYGSLAFAGIANLATSGPVWIECIATLTPGAFVGARITATTVYDLVTLP